ncbi:MAG: right-handed parallel beta-helix repeat-containing protein, partial [Anaerolineae bacterium]|nr:right-handed parallel beta-helix repeat-containing protein [Anaerolineae bacterium]
MKTNKLFLFTFILFLSSVINCQTGAAGSVFQRTPLSNSTGQPLATIDVASQRNSFCPALPAPAGPTVTVSTEADLRDRAYNAAPGTTILVSPGVYNLTNVVQVVNNNITIRSSTGNRADVILDGGGMLTGTFTHAILIEADDVTIANLTIRNADEHGISVNGSDRPTLYNLHLIDTGYQLVKVNPAGDGSEDGLLACSRLEYTTAAPTDYTNGISAHNAHRWTVRDNDWYRIRTPGNAATPTILFWSGSADTVVERNLLVNCYQGIAFGNADHGPGDHTGGIVRNNFIYASQLHDSVIEMVHATGWVVAHNTALLLNPNGLTWGMEARYPDTSGTFAYNLSNMTIWVDRDGAGGIDTGNVVTAQSSWFANPAQADLHLVADATQAIDQAAARPDITNDFDGDLRPNGSAPDAGADEYYPDTVYLPVVTKTPASPPADGALVQPADLVYRGAFRLPGGDTPPQTFAYGGNAMTFNPDNGSLFVM